MAVREIAAVRRSARKSIRMTDTSSAPEQERGGDVAERQVDEGRGPEDIGVERDALALERRGQGLERCLDISRHQLGVGAELRRHDGDDGGLAVDGTVAELGRAGDDHLGHVVDAEHGAVPLAHHHLPDRFGRERLPLGAHHDALVGAVEHATAADAGGATGGLGELGETHAVGAETRGIDLHLQLAHFPAERRDLGDAGRGEQPRAHHPVDHGALLQQRAGLRGEADDQHRARRRGERADDRWRHRARQARHRFHQSLGERLAGAEDVGAGRQHGGDDGETLDRLRADDGDAGHAVDDVLDRLGDEDLDLLRREAGGLGLDGDLRRCELGKDVERCGEEARRAVHHQHDGEPEDDPRMTDREANECGEHQWCITPRPRRPPAPAPGTPRTAAARRPP